jgi:hypothetical protein
MSDSSRCDIESWLRTARLAVIALGLAWHEPSGGGIKVIAIMLESDSRCVSAWERHRRSQLRRGQTAFFTADSTGFHLPVRRVAYHAVLFTAQRADALAACVFTRKDALMEWTWLAAALAFTLFAVVLARFVGE